MNELLWPKNPETDAVAGPGDGEAVAAPGRSHQTVLILDFGSQYTQLIARRVRENRVFCEILGCQVSADAVAARAPIGIVLSGGPDSVYAEDAPRLDADILSLGIPVLGICYGMQLIAQRLGGEVSAAEAREYGRAEIEVLESGCLFRDLKPRQPVWMSHGDRIEQPPAGFVVTARSENAPIVAFEHAGRRIFGLQFHPEVSHTTAGVEILRNFLFHACGAAGDWVMASFLDRAEASLAARIGTSGVVCGISGGVDSSVTALLLSRAIPREQLHLLFIDNGLLRKEEASQVIHALRDDLRLPVALVDAREEFLTALATVQDPELKRKTIGRLFVKIFRRVGRDFSDARFLAQGTLYPDVIESSAVRGPSAVIKSHHNVGGLPAELGFELIEPLRFLFKDEVRTLGRELGLPENFIRRHPFPGPGLAVRVIGAVTRERVALLQEADAIFLDELRRFGYYDRVSQAFAVLLPIKSVGVMGDERTYENVVALRSADTGDFMTADWSPLPHELLASASSRIVNEVDGVNRIVYDITSKPPGTIEWE